MGRPTAGYRAKDGERVPGTTTIVGRFDDKSALMYWAFKQGRLAEQGKINSLYDKRDEAAQVGTFAHEMFDAHLRGKEIPVPSDPIKEKAEQAFQNALHWLENTRLEIEPHETPLVSEQYRYGGTPDAICMDQQGKLHLADWKTGGIYASHIIQMGAYKQLLKECQDVDVEGVHLIRFAKDTGDFHHHFFAPDALDEGWEVFQHELELWPLMKRLDKRAK